MFAEPSDDLLAALKPLKERLAHIPKGQDTLGFLTSIASVITQAFVICGKTAPTIVGGLAVETYTGGGYTTLDIDMVTADDKAAMQIMLALGFTRRPGHRYFEHPSLGALVEFPAGPLEGSSDRITEIRLQDGTALYMIGIEDIILDRVAAYVHWDRRNPDSEDATQAVLLLVA